jgi:hypothetical protein
MKQLHLPLLLVAAVLSSFLTMLLLPYILIVFLHHWERHEADRLASAANPHSPTDAVRCDGGEPEQAFDLPIDAPATLESYPLPDVFAEWINKKGLR